MKKLIVFISWGEAYNEMLNTCIESLLPNIDDTYTVKVISPDFEREGIEIIRHWTASRINIDHRIDIYPYDFVYYFDHDIIFRRHLNELQADEERITCSRELRTYMDNPCVNLLQADLNSVRGELGINNGSIIVPRKYMREFFPKWREITEWYKSSHNNDYTKFFACQSSLNKMYANKVFEFGFFGEDQVHWPADSQGLSQVTERTVFSHYAGMTMEERKIKMK